MLYFCRMKQKDMKKIRLFIYLLAALMVCACAKDARRHVAPLPEGITQDFITRYPRANVLETGQWQRDSHTITEISFIDRYQFENRVIYQDNQWMLTEKSYDIERFKSTIPFKVLTTFLDTGIYDERFSDNDFVIEVSRNGMDQKQYEIHCSAGFVDEPVKKAYDSWQHHIVIAEDGTLLSCQHSSYNSTFAWFDMSESIALARDKYADAEFLGAVNDAGSNVLFIRDNGILKAVTIHRTWTYEWKDTRYPLSLDTPLPASVMDKKAEYESEHPDSKMFALYHVDSPEGTFYGLTFGSELNYATIFAPID